MHRAGRISHVHSVCAKSYTMEPFGCYLSSYISSDSHVGGCTIYRQTYTILWIMNKTRNPVVTRRRLIVFFVSKFLSHKKTFTTTDDIANWNVARTEHNVITTKPIKMSLASLCTCTYAVKHRYLQRYGYYLTSYFSSDLHMGGRTDRQTNTILWIRQDSLNPGLALLSVCSKGVEPWPISWVI